MLNQPKNSFAGRGADGGGAERPWHVDQRPWLRLATLFVLMILPLGAISGRLVYVQCLAADGLTVSPEHTVVTFEPIASRDGRIVASDGRVLAHDIERYNVLVHYRWLQEPADPVWLREQARSRLSRGERKNAERIKAESRTVLALRPKMWATLADVNGLSQHELAERRSRIQGRIERIRALVETRRQQLSSTEDRVRSQAEASAAVELPNPQRIAETDDSGWKAAWHTIVAALTQPAEPESLEPLIIQEELQYHVLLDNVALETAAEIEAHPARYPGLRTQIATQRVYPQRTLAAHLVGVRTMIGNDELASRQARFPTGDPLNYQPGDRIGQSGVERAYDRFFHGLRGERRVVTDRNGEVVHTDVVREPRAGRDVVLTLSLPLQDRAEQLLDRVVGANPDGDSPHHSAPETGGSVAETDGEVTPTQDQRPPGGCIVAVDVQSGAVLAAAAAPRFDLNVIGGVDQTAWRKLIDDPRRPLFPRATHMALAPGSVFKIITAIALLESGVDPDQPTFCQGFLDRPDRHRCLIYQRYGAHHGDMDLSHALCQSCNVYFFTAARKIGPESICHWATQFGFGAPTGIDVAGESTGNLPQPSARWYPGDTLGLAIGQSRLVVTPVQIARMMAAVANGGFLVTPHLVHDVGSVVAIDDAAGADADGLPFTDESFLLSASQTPARRSVGVSEATLARVREGLEQVVSHPKGTGYKHVRLSEVAIAGKTGTAEVAGGSRDHAWFAGYVPADQPRIAFVVVLQHAGSGGAAAGPVARDFVKAMLELGLLRSTAVTMKDSR